MMAIDGNWNIAMRTPLGRQVGKLRLETNGSGLGGEWSSALGSGALSEGRVEGDTLSWKAPIAFPVAGAASFIATVNGDTLQGSVNLHTRPTGNVPAPFTGTRA